MSIGTEIRLITVGFKRRMINDEKNSTKVTYAIPLLEEVAYGALRTMTEEEIFEWIWNRHMKDSKS